MQCMNCGGPVPLKASTKHGTQPKLCSEACRNANRKRYIAQWLKENSEKFKSYRTPERLTAWNKSFYARHRERRSKLANEWYHENAKKALETQRKWSKAHPDQVRANGRRSAMTRRARLRDLFVEVVDPKVVFERDSGVCGICQQPIDGEWHVDHKVPLAKGGLHAYENVQAAHATCNRSKGARVTAW